MPMVLPRRVDDALLATLPRLRLVAVAFTGTVRRTIARDGAVTCGNLL